MPDYERLELPYSLCYTRLHNKKHRCNSNKCYGEHHFPPHRLLDHWYWIRRADGEYAIITQPYADTHVEEAWPELNARFVPIEVAEPHPGTIGFMLVGPNW